MKRIWLAVLMISVGLNLGLSWRLYQLGHAAAPAPQIALPPDGSPPGPGDEGPDPERMAHQRLERMAQDLGLSPQQKAAFAAIHHGTAEEFFQRRRAIMQQRRELRDLYVTGQIDHQDVMARQRQLSTMQAALDSIVVETMIQEVRLLTPEQRERYQQIMPWGVPGGGGDHGGRRRADRPGRGGR